MESLYYKILSSKYSNLKRKILLQLCESVIHSEKDTPTIFNLSQAYHPLRLSTSYHSCFFRDSIKNSWQQKALELI